MRNAAGKLTSFFTNPDDATKLASKFIEHVKKSPDMPWLGQIVDYKLVAQQLLKEDFRDDKYMQNVVNCHKHAAQLNNGVEINELTSLLAACQKREELKRLIQDVLKAIQEEKNAMVKKELQSVKSILDTAMKDLAVCRAGETKPQNPNVKNLEDTITQVSGNLGRTMKSNAEYFDHKLSKRVEDFWLSMPEKSPASPTIGSSYKAK